MGRSVVEAVVQVARSQSGWRQASEEGSTHCPLPNAFMRLAFRKAIRDPRDPWRPFPHPFPHQHGNRVSGPDQFPGPDIRQQDE